MPPPPIRTYAHPPQGRFSPYPKTSRFPGHRNLTLVVNNNTSDQTGTDAAATGTPATPGWVSTRDRGHLTLTNTSVFDQRAQEKKLAMEQTSELRRRERSQRERNKILRMGTRGPQKGYTANPQPNIPREIVVDDLRFRVASDGSKLIRILGEQGTACVARTNMLKATDGNANPRSTPKTTKVAGVTFHRSKNGNLIRAGVVKQQRYWTLQPLVLVNGFVLTTSSSREIVRKKSTKLCPAFTSTGTIPSIHTRLQRTLNIKNCLWPPGKHTDIATGKCAHGDRCRDIHDINKLAICKDFLRQGYCAAGEEACNLSHYPTPNRVPACTHFQRGACNKDDCRYAHVHDNASAPVCRNFALIGYCDKGAVCTERHVSECPDYTNKGACRNTKCRLPHIDTAATLRKVAAAKANKGTDDSSDMSSDEGEYQEIDSEDVDSDDDVDEDMIFTGSGDGGNELAQQDDFIAFS